MTVAQVPVPLPFLRDVVPGITNPDELLVSLAVFRLLAESGNEETPIAERSIIGDPSLRQSLRISGPAATLDERIFDALELAVGRNTLLRFLTVSDERESAWYFTNTPVTRAMVAAMQQDRIPAPRVVWDGEHAPQVAIDPPNVFRLYEQNIGPLTPIIADQLTLAAGEYPGAWIEDAISEAVSYNKRNWRYILRILENWRQSGRPGEN
jgi:DnaD/phage-associated family protein